MAVARQFSIGNTSTHTLISSAGGGFFCAQKLFLNLVKFRLKSDNGHDNIILRSPTTDITKEKITMTRFSLWGKEVELKGWTEYPSCTCCGKQKLKRTMALFIGDSLEHYGSVCIRKMIPNQKLATKIIAEANYKKEVDDQLKNGYQETIKFISKKYNMSHEAADVYIKAYTK